MELITNTERAVIELVIGALAQLVMLIVLI